MGYQVGGDGLGDDTGDDDAIAVNDDDTDVDDTSDEDDDIFISSDAWQDADLEGVAQVMAGACPLLPSC